jgi:hypothetical protein
MSLSGSAGFGGVLRTRVVRAPRSSRVYSIRIPGFGRVMLTRDQGDSHLLSREVFYSHLHATHRDRTGQIVKRYDLGSGLVTNVGVLALANDFNWLPGQTIALNLFRVLGNHATGTGVTAAAVTDIKLQTPSGFGGQTMVAGAQTFIPGTNAGGTGTSTTGTNKFQSVATINYTGTEAVTEWALLGNLGAIGGTALSSATGSPFTAGSATTGTVTATPLTASAAGVQGQVLTVVENTGNATPHWGLVTANSTSVFTVPAWYKVSDSTAAGTFPANTNAFVSRPIMWDHKVFAAINVNNGDSIQFTYQLIPNQGG